MSRGSIPFDQIADSYDATRGGLDRGREVAAQLHRVLPAGPLLEVGVGTGLVAAALAEQGRPVFGVDLSLPMLAHAAARLPGRVAAGDAHRLPVRTGAVGGAYLVHVLHLVGDLGATFAELHRVLRPGGLLVATVRALPPTDDNDVRDLMAGLLAAFPSEVERADREELVDAAARAHGFTATDRLLVRRTGYQSTPRQVADRVAERSWSWMWDIPGDEWHAVADPVVAALRALPDQDRGRGEPEVAPVLVFRRT